LKSYSVGAVGQISSVGAGPELLDIVFSNLGRGAKGIVARIDTAVSDEDFKVQMMVAQPFQF